MNLQERKEILVRLGNYLRAADEDWQRATKKASAENAWFTPEFIALSVNNISRQFLTEQSLQDLIDRYSIPSDNPSPKKVGIVMAGNIPLVGFHDLLCTFLTGHYAVIKLSSKDAVLMRFMVTKLIEWNAAAAPYFTFGEMLKGCDVYIATGSNNTSNYFEFYFAKYPHIIRKNRTSVALLTGQESAVELEQLADDVYQFFGLGCRNVTKIFVPENYNFEPLLEAFKKYNDLADHQKYKNNYDYNLAIYLLNKRYFMSNQSLLLVEDASPFSRIGELHYEYYQDAEAVRERLSGDETIQCVVGRGDVPFGKAQRPGICDFADGVDTVQFLLNLQ
ncbi:acyl-CoA reductase [Flavisolibacter nicotianae]|uniref:acyl-CoA reductase n=1 Tax=Flavisolibacter nicotianae TaxID=2364882 RepID=UPI000EAD63B5|nr:acyl-CoA reductase [Flavisolibacter nicotianae]